MWQCACFALILIVYVWFFSYGIMRNNNEEKQAIQVNIVQSEQIRDGNVTTTEDVFFGRKVKQHVPKVMLEFYENSKSVHKDKRNGRHPDVVRSVLPIYAGTPSSHFIREGTNVDNHMLVFNVPNSNKDELFIKAELRVLTLIELKSKFALGIERQIKVSFFNETTSTLIFLEEKHIYHTDSTWISFNLSQVTRTILSGLQKEKTLKLIITIKIYQEYKNNKTGIFKLSLLPITQHLEHDYPVLLLFYASSKLEFSALNEVENSPSSTKGNRTRMRNKRYAEEDYEEEFNKVWDDDLVSKAVSRRMRRFRNNCKRRSLYVDFAEIEYDTWIVQPSGYEAYQCAGKCFYPVAEHLSPTKHAIVQALLHSVAPSRAPRPCCVPTKLDSISVLYVDLQGVLTYRYAYKDMVVTECGCR